jgi:hypothetical protein
MKTSVIATVLVVALVVAGCGMIRNILGIPSPGDPSVTLRSAEPRWLLVKNPRYGDVPSEPEYIWVEEDKVPTTLKTLIRGKGAIIAPPEVVAKYGPPPGGGRIGARQGMPYQVNAPEGRAPQGASRAAATQATAEASRPETGRASDAVSASLPAETPRRGLVVWVDTTRVVFDLTAHDGVRQGGLVSLRRDKIPIVHPVTGEMLGELDEEVATARVTEVREKFSVAEIQNVAPGAQVQVRDRVVPK